MKQYPLPIQDRIQEVILELDDFIKEEGIDTNILKELLCESLLPKFISGDELTWEYNEIEYLLKLSIVNTIIEGLKSQGYLNSVEDENGEEWLWATEEGKQALEEHKPKKRKKRK